VVEDVVVEGARERARVVELVGVDAGGRAAGDVAHVVGAGPARHDGEVVERREDLDGAVGRDAAELEVRARRHVPVAGREPLGDVGDAAELVRRDDPAREPQAAHERLLSGRDVEQPVKLPAEHVGAAGEPAGLRVLDDAVPGVERVLGPLRLLLWSELPSFGDEAVLRAQVHELRPARRQGRARAPALHERQHVAYRREAAARARRVHAA
jgi:hypothetical protein